MKKTGERMLYLSIFASLFERMCGGMHTIQKNREQNNIKRKFLNNSNLNILIMKKHVLFLMVLFGVFAVRVNA